MSKKKKIAWLIAIVFVVIQFIRPARNSGDADTPRDITRVVDVPENIKSSLVISCYDCHSNHTNHKWYENIQPLGWWINHHITEGKEELNFSEFAAYSDKRKAHKLKEIAEMVKEHEMPISSYLLVHKEAALSLEQEKALVAWANKSKESFTIK